MRTWTKPDRQWFEWPLLALKLGVVLAGPGLLLYSNALSQGYKYTFQVHEHMKSLAIPVGLGCLGACLLLVATGVMEFFRRRRKQAIWDFAFAAVALFSWVICASLAVRVK